MRERVIEAFFARFQQEPVLVVRAPGRVNLIGEHTDYNEGFVLPMAINRAAWIAARPRMDRRVVVHSLDFKRTATFNLEAFFRKGNGWVEYVKGTAWALLEEGYPLHGWEGVLAGEVPIGAGLSSSAAVEMAVARTFAGVSGFDWEPAGMAQAGQRCENEWMGVQSGIMDQLVSAGAREGHALFIDCRSLQSRDIPVPAGISVAILDTATRRGLVGSAYNERRAQCMQAAQLLGVGSLREVGLEQFEKEKHKLSGEILRRARHVVTENQRVLVAVKAMEANDLDRFGKLLDASHASLRDDYEVSSLALDQMVESAREHPACLGARMTGAGFGGCAVAVVEASEARSFMEHVSSRYRERSGNEAAIYVSEASAGAEIVSCLCSG